MTDKTHTPDAAREAYMYDFAAWLHHDVVLDRVPTDWLKSTDVPRFRISFGKAPGMRESRKHKILGACMNTKASSDSHNEIFLDITGDEVDTVKVLETFVHEYVHALDDCESGHSGRFARIARALDLSGPLTATTAGSELREALIWYVEEHGPIPAGAIRTAQRRKPKQTTRMQKVACTDHANCGFNFRTSAAQIAKLPGGATCPACNTYTLEIV